MLEIKTKPPVQLRSRFVVESILEAATRILLEKGMTKLTTNHVAELAGVSIGSLYQYFSNKESIIVKLIETHKENEIKRISKIMLKLQDNPTCHLSASTRKNNIRLVIKEFINVHAENLELARILEIENQNLANFHALQDTSSVFTALLNSLLDEVDRFSKKTNYTRAYIISNSLDFLLRKTLVDNPQMFKEPEFLDELVNLSIGYLQPV